MRFLIRYHVERSGDTEYRDVDFEGNRITIGHGIDQIIKIPTTRIANEYAVIELQSRNKGRIRARTEAGVEVNDNHVKSASLSLGDVIIAGPSQLEVIKPPAGFDFALASIRTSTDPEDYASHSRFSTRAEKAPLSRRRWSWALFSIFIIAGLILPFIGLQSIPMINDQLWASGPLQAPHNSLECQQCHSTPFIRVRNQQCLECHEDVDNHIDLQVHSVPDLATARCASCHIEHNEPSGLVRNHQELCSDCHEELTDVLATTEIANIVSDFANDHPPFKLTLLAPTAQSADTGWELKRGSVTDDLKEMSNLRFPHDKHLDPDGVNSRSVETGKEVLECTSCHQLDAAGEYILPISMEKDCRRCHELTFDPDDIEREVPHGDPDLVQLTIEEYYSRKYLGEVLSQQAPQPDRSQSSSSIRRRVGGGSQGQPEQTLDVADALATEERIQQSTEQAMARLFAKDTAAVKPLCLQCHELEKTDAEDYRSNWRIIPVRLTQRWMPLSNFSHHSHRIVEIHKEDGSTVNDCEVCHQAKESTQSSDILMPSLATCHECHGSGLGESKKIASTCVMCHSFHLPGRGKMATLQD